MKEIVEALGLSRRSVQRYLATLRDEGYLTTWQDQHGFTAVISIWDAGRQENTARGDKSGAPAPAVRDDKSGAPEHESVRDDSSVAPGVGSGVTDMAHLGLWDDKSVIPENPPAPPLRVLEESSLDSSCSGGFLNVPTTAKRARVVPLRGGQEADAPRPVAVAAGPSPGRLRQEQAIAHLIGRIEAWERPELTRTLLDNLCQVPLSQLPLVFEQVWRFHRTRRKDLDNPAGWWAAMLARSVQECRRNMKGAHDYG
ncbi:MAG: hypothetical protein HY794_18435 [Desulfarculus sp.]|nr:hypothetical protein [Desulfarculus sp.]